MVNSIRKGKNFEREVVKILNKYTNAVWKRVPMSGAFSTRENVLNNVFKGDVFTEDPDFCDIVIECKVNKKTLNLIDLMSIKGLFFKWIRQVTKEAKNSDWLLFFKDGSHKVYVVVPIDSLNDGLYYLVDMIRDKDYLPIRISGSYDIFRVLK